MIKRLILFPIHLLWKIKNKFLRFLFVGGINTVFGYLLFLFLIWLGLHYTLALLLSQIIGVLFNYKTTGYLVFQNKSNNLLIKFFLVYAFVYLVNVVELYFLKQSSFYELILSKDYLRFIHNLPIDTTKLGDAIGQAIVILPNAILTFFLNKIFVFKENKMQEEVLDAIDILIEENEE
ncbi:MAG: GtrA family protein [Bacteroidales bacterium]|nr:GtrA family protein [Bacteroidales bacterium]